MKVVLKEYTADDGKIFIKAGNLGKLFDMGRTTIWRNLNKMRTLPKYKDSFLDLSYGLRLVNVADFKQFLQEESADYLKKDNKKSPA